MFRKWWFWVIVVFGLIAVVCAMSGIFGTLVSGPKEEPELLEPIQPEPEAEEEVTEPEPATEEPAPTVNVGENITVGEVRWKVLNAEKKDQIEQEYGEPLTADGVFVVIKLEAELLGKESGTILGSQFKLVDSAGRSFETDSDATMGLIFGETKPIIFEEIHPNVPRRATLPSILPRMPQHSN